MTVEYQRPDGHGPVVLGERTSRLGYAQMRDEHEPAPAVGRGLAEKPAAFLVGEVDVARELQVARPCGKTVEHARGEGSEVGVPETGRSTRPSASLRSATRSRKRSLASRARVPVSLKMKATEFR